MREVAIFRSIMLTFRIIMLTIAWASSLFYLVPLTIRLVGTWREFELSSSWTWLVYMVGVFISLALAQRSSDHKVSVFWSAVNLTIAIGYPLLLIIGR
jgi:hypothetical protein